MEHNLDHILEEINISSSNLYASHIQNINISKDFGREGIYELGKKAPYYKAVQFPLDLVWGVWPVEDLNDVWKQEFYYSHIYYPYEVLDELC